MATFDPYNEQIMGLREQQALAQKLRDQGLEMPQGQMVSGHFVAPATTQYLAQALKGYLGGQDVEAAKQGIKDLMAQRLGERQKWMESAPQEQTVQVEDRSSLPEKQQTQMGPSPYSKALRVKPTIEDTLAWYTKMPGADETTIGQGVLKAAELSEAQKARQDALRAQMAQQAYEKERDRLNRLDIAKLTVSNRPERILNVLGPNGESIALPQSQVTPGMALWSPAGAKHAQDVTSKESGRKQLSSTLDELAGYYNKLDLGLGIPSTSNKVGSNIGAWAEGTGAGNWLGRTGILGKASEENASMRDSIAQTRPLLLADIKKATGMTASEMNSNAELQMWLSVATDPTKGYESNMRALQNLEKKFGLGRGDEKTNPFLKAAPAATGTTQNVQVNY